MERLLQQKFDSLERARAFLEVQAEVLGPLGTTAGAKALDAAIAAVSAYAMAQGVAQRELDGASNQARRIEQDLKKYLLTPLAGFARAQLRESPEFGALHGVPHGIQGRRLASAARAMASAAKPHLPALVAAQWAEDGERAIEQAADALDGAIDACADARARRRIGTVGIPIELTRGRNAVNLLDAVVTKKLALRPDLLAAWRMTKRVVQVPSRAEGA
jgi:hypothetical protein